MDYFVLWIFVEETAVLKMIDLIRIVKQESINIFCIVSLQETLKLKCHNLLSFRKNISLFKYKLIVFDSASGPK